MEIIIVDPIIGEIRINKIDNTKQVWDGDTWKSLTCKNTINLVYINDAKEKSQSYEINCNITLNDYNEYALYSYGYNKNDMLKEFQDTLILTKDGLVNNINDINNILNDINKLTTDEFGEKYFKDNPSWNKDYKELNRYY